jgi:signal transduction histidine kinase
MRWNRRFWPQKVRTKLTLIYAALFLAGGSLLLGLTYGLLAASLPTQAQTAGKPPMALADYIKLCKSPGAAVPPGKPGQRKPTQSTQRIAIEAKIKKQCSQERAYLAGSAAAAAKQRQRALANLLLFSVLGLGIMTVLSAAAGWIIAGRVLRPVRMITGTARRASQENLGERIALAGAKDELKELADTFDDMLERLDSAFAAQRRFVADASHELRTPLTVMRTAIDVTLAKPGRTEEQLESMAIRVRDAIERAEGMVDALLTLAISEQGRAGNNQPEPFSLATAAEDALDAAAADVERLSLRLRTDLDPAETAGDPALLDRMVSNLVDNAIRHNVPGGEISLASGVRDGTAFLWISNSGPLVPADLVPSLFEPFRRLEARTGSGAGAGLGLAIARSVAAVHGTTVRAVSRPEGGLEVEVTFAARATDAAPAEIVVVS